MLYQGEFTIKYMNLRDKLHDWSSTHQLKLMSTPNSPKANVFVADAVRKIAQSFEATFGLNPDGSLNTKLTKKTTVSYADFTTWIDGLLAEANEPLDPTKYEKPDDAMDAELYKHALRINAQIVKRQFAEAKHEHDTQA
jgi:hypothetical protein